MSDFLIRSQKLSKKDKFIDKAFDEILMSIAMEKIIILLLVINNDLGPRHWGPENKEFPIFSNPYFINEHKILELISLVDYWGKRFFFT